VVNEPDKKIIEFLGCKIGFLERLRSFTYRLDIVSNRIALRIKDPDDIAVLKTLYFDLRGIRKPPTITVDTDKGIAANLGITDQDLGKIKRLESMVKSYSNSIFWGHDRFSGDTENIYEKRAYENNKWAEKELIKAFDDFENIPFGKVKARSVRSAAGKAAEIALVILVLSYPWQSPIYRNLFPKRASAQARTVSRSGLSYEHSLLSLRRYHNLYAG
jgi:hypothetical protein